MAFDGEGLWVPLASYRRDFGDVGPGRLVRVDPAADAVTAVVDLPEPLRGCVAASYVAGAKRIAVVCVGDFERVADVGAAQRESSGVVLVDPNREVIKHVRACLAHDTIRVRKMARLDHAPPHLPEPLHRVLVTGSVPHLPAWLARRMSEGGFALAPIGGRLHQRLEKLEKVGDAFESTDLGGVIFGPVDIADTEPEPFSPASLAELMQEAAALGEEMDVLSNEDVQRLQGLAGVLVNLHEEPDLPTLGEPEEGDGVPWVFDVDRHEDHPVLDVLLAEIDWLAPLWPTLLALVDVRIMRPGVDDEGGGGVFGRHTDLEP